METTKTRGIQEHMQASQEPSSRAAQVAQVLQLVLQEGFAPDLQTVCTAWLPRYPGMLVEMELQLETHPQRLQIAHAVTAAMANCSTPAASAATKSSADRTATCGQHLSHTHVPLKLRSFTADCQLVNATVLQSLDADIWSCYLRSFEMRQATPAFCGALGRLTGLHELTLVPSFGQGALPTAAVAALPRLPALRHLELAIKPSAVHLLPASLVLLTAVLTGSSDACGGASHSNPTASVAKSSSARTAVVDVSHMDRLAELQSRAPGGGRFTIKVPDYIVTVGAKHPVRYLTAAMRTSTSGARDQQDPERQITGPAALAAAAQTISERKHGLKVLWMRLILPQVEDFAVLQDLQLEELSDLKLSLGFSCGDTVQLEQGPQQQLQLQRAAASLSRCTHISDLFFSVSGQENPSFVGSIPWCQSIAQLMRLRKLDLIMDWMQPDDLLQLSVLTLLTYLALDTEVDDYTATSLLLQFTDLKGLYLRCSVLQTTAVLAVIPRLTTVQCLQLMGWGDMGQEIDMRDAQLLQLVPLQQLKRLQLPLVSQCSREAVDQFLAGMSQLRLLSVKADEAEDWSNPVMFW